ncbi:alpha/beta hydrolase family protein [Larkinella terrae]|uniref:Prolyl oligopeptidase family serine peptidase n=1 Tax=Larkinella terrae TaxID=2025311 RepID=A0A7K0EIL8_9BACT|nr:alpha/beta hydrolase [Larkinella terrae]MRS61431.1 prolyl oligopeptidase family serine peptidase [Larkinella terrae]
MTRLIPFFVFFLSVLTAAGQSSSVASADTGIIGQARYRIDFPANWNQAGGPKRLLLYAHGYETIGSKHGPLSGGWMTPFLKKGFAVAQSAYRRQGWAVSEGVDDTEALRQYFVKKYGQPDTTFITGHSMGGMITLATIEKYPQHYQGALPFCPVSEHISQFLQGHLFEMLVTFDALFPNTLTLEKLANGTAKPISGESIAQKLAIDSLTGQQFARRFAIKYKDLPSVLWFFQEIYRDISQQAGGNPFDNTNALYSGFPDDALVNRRAIRLMAQPRARSFLGPYTYYSGKISDPVLLVHTTYDELIPPENGTAYDAIVRQAGNDRLFVMKFTNGQGHCRFTPGQTEAVFDQLRNWVKAGQKPVAGEVK